MPDEPIDNGNGQTGETQGDAGQQTDTPTPDPQIAELQTGLASVQQSIAAMADQAKKAQDAQFSMIRKFKGGDDSTAGDPDPDPPKPGTDDAVVTLRTQYQFGRALDRADVTDRDRQRLERLFELELELGRPIDPVEWLAKEMKDLETPNPNPGTPSPDTPAPTGAKPTGERATDKLNWTKADWMEDFARNAPHPSNFHDIRNRPYFKKVSEMMQARMNDVRIYLGPAK